jgi:hypothetical protein
VAGKAIGKPSKLHPLFKTVEYIKNLVFLGELQIGATLEDINDRGVGVLIATSIQFFSITPEKLEEEITVLL